MTLQTARTEALDIAYNDLGESDGPTVVLLHGWPDAARGWVAIAGDLAAAGWRVLVPDLRGSGNTRFPSDDTPRDGQAVAIAQDALDLADALGVGRFAVVGHDWGGRVAYTLSALEPQRITAAVALALAYQPRGRFEMPSFPQARAFWYQWLMYVGAGADAVGADPVGFAREMWDTWSPSGWFDEAEFAATAASFANPDWVAITLNAYRFRFLADEPRDPRYDDLRARLDAVEQISVPTLMIQGGADFCDPPEASEGLEPYFDTYERVVIDGAGHFPHREATAAVSELVRRHLECYGRR